MIYYDRIDVSERIDFYKKVHKKSIMFVTIGIFKCQFQPNACNRCRSLLMM